jgi:glycosyltransferase involved in cell wall biosynthesis
MGLAEGAIRVVYNGSPVPALDGAAALRTRLRTELGIAEATPLALFVGRLVDHKNLPMLLDAMHRLQQQGSPVHLMVVGDGPLRAEVEAQRAGQGLQDRVTLLGERSDVPALMNAADLVVLTSLREGLSNIVLEAMMAGRAVIATRVGGNVELVEPERTGLLVDSNDAAGLADAITRLVQDATTRTRLGEAARQRGVAHFGIPAMVAAYRELYGDLLAGRSVARP